MKKLDTIYINDLVVSCIIGIFEDERIKKQPVIINIALSVDTRKAAVSDNLNDTVSYHDIYLEINELVGKSKFFLIEKLAQEIATLCLKDKRVKQVVVHIEKPNAVKLGKSSAIEITRSNEK
ncbi:dihydroneopterin aldolase [Candidatus Roizmanbacteria bacterium]|nr:dihydroneopterin aldolase [Candidatus Roizmanbacteria bacterium]